MTGRSRSAVVGLERLERLVAVHARHDDVEQDDVDRRRGRRPRSRSSASRPSAASTASWPIVVQEADEQPPVERRVVDDQHAAGRSCGRSQPVPRSVRPVAASEAWPAPPGRSASRCSRPCRRPGTPRGRPPSRSPSSPRSAGRRRRATGAGSAGSPRGRRAPASGRPSGRRRSASARSRRSPRARCRRRRRGSPSARGGAARASGSPGCPRRAGSAADGARRGRGRCPARLDADRHRRRLGRRAPWRARRTGPTA